VASGESLFEPGTPEVRRRQAQSLLNDYSHPWDVLAEALQNSVDAINRLYREKIAAALAIGRDQLETGIELAAEHIVPDDVAAYETAYETWRTPEYINTQRDRWFDALSAALALQTEKVESAYVLADKSYKGKIRIERDDNSRKIVIRDNGIGMSHDEVRSAVKKGVTIKRFYSDIGELGNGLTYLVSACDRFRLQSSNGTELTDLEIDGMYSWILDVGGKRGIPEPLSDPKATPRTTDRFTEVTLEAVRTVDSDFPDIFGTQMPTNRLAHLIRSKTAIGYLYDALRFPVFDGLRQSGMVVELHDTVSGTASVQDVRFAYEGPAQLVRALHPVAMPPVLTLDSAKAQVAAHQDIGGKAIEHVGIFRSATDRPLYYSCFLANRDWYPSASKSAGLCDEPAQPDIRRIGRHDVAPSIELGVKGMPTGVSVDPPVTGFQGYWGNFHTIILDNRLKFDEGRKTPVGRRVTLYRDCARSALFNQIGVDLVGRAIKDPVIALNLSEMAKSKEELITARLKPRSPLGLSSVAVQNVPKYEQDVIILFHELVGNGTIPYYHCLDSCSNSTYDGIYRYKIQRNLLGASVQVAEGSTGSIDEVVVVEFKHDGEWLVADVGNNVKFYYMIDILICWDISAAECARQSANLVDKPLDKVKYWGTTHELQLSPVNFMNIGTGRSLEVICLRRLLQLLGSGNYNLSEAAASRSTLSIARPGRRRGRRTDSPNNTGS
jgi:hypothetical protein